MRALGLVLLGFAGLIGLGPIKAFADTGASCSSTRFGSAVVCGGEFVIQTPSAPATGPAPTPHPHPPTQAATGPKAVHTTPLAFYVANGPNGPCMALGPANPAPNATVMAWLASVHYPNCPPAPPNAGPPPPPIDPVTLAVQFWQTIPLPVPRPAVPPGYAVTGKEAYLVTNGTVAPPPYVDNTPLGQLTLTVTGTYLVDWGDPAQPGWAGPYAGEGQPWPAGQIRHTYDYAGTDTVTVEEQWSAVWHLAGATGTLGGLHTRATIPALHVEQLQAVLTN